MLTELNLAYTKHLNLISADVFLHPKNDERDFSYIDMHIYSSGLFCLLCMVYLPFKVYGQVNKEITLTHIQLPDIHSNRTTNDILQDQRGTLWIANNNGLFLYDGVKCQAYANDNIHPVQMGAVYNIAEDEYQRLWLNTQHGLFILNKPRNQYISPRSIGISDSILFAPNLNFCRGTKKELFILSGNTIYIYKNGILHVWARYPTMPPLNSQKKVIMMYDKKKEQIFFYSPGNIFCIFKKNGIVNSSWNIQNEDKAITYSDPKTLILTITNTFADSVTVFVSLQPDSTITPLHFDGSNGTFTSTSQKSLSNDFSLADIYTYFIDRYRPDLSLKNIGSVKIFRISPDVLALTSYEGILLLKIQYPKFKYLKESLGQRIRAIQEDAFGHLIFGTYEGTKYLHKKHGSLRQLSADYPSPWSLCAWSILPISHQMDHFVMQGEDKTNILYFIRSTPMGVRIVKQMNNIGNIKARSFNTCMAYDQVLQGIWHITNDNHLTFYDISSSQNRSFYPVIHERGERAMIRQGDDIWFGGSEGLQRLSTPDFNTKSYENLTYTIPISIRNLNINTMFLDNNQHLWIGTNATGIFRYEIKSGAIEQFTTNDGLSENSVFSILAEKGDSVLWLGTGKGLSRLDVKKRWFDNYYKEDGLSDNEFNTASTLRGLDGTFYMGGQNGINYFHPDSFKTNPQTLIHYAIIKLQNNGVHDLSQLMLSTGDSLEISSNVQIIEVNFRSDDYFHTNQVYYRYRIPGIIDDWQYLSNADKTLFPKLPAGRYYMEVQAKGVRGMWSSNAHYSLIILPKWHETWWFKIAVTLLICMTLYGIYRIRIRFLRREFDLRQQISHDLHDELGSRIFLMRSLSDQITNPLTPNEEKQNKLKRLEEISQDTFQSIRDFIWAFDPRQDDVNQLFERMEDFAENYLSPLIPELNIEHAETTVQKRISPRVKHHVLNIYQELLTNMVKHTHCQSIHITLRCYEQTLLVHIMNQHTGLKPREKENPLQIFGQESIQNRLREINGQMNWQEKSQIQSITVSVSL